MQYILKICPFCHSQSLISVMEDELLTWRSGTLIQKALISNTPEERETLISGICASCQKEIFE